MKCRWLSSRLAQAWCSLFNMWFYRPSNRLAHTWIFLFNMWSCDQAGRGEQLGGLGRQAVLFCKLTQSAYQQLSHIWNSWLPSEISQNTAPSFHPKWQDVPDKCKAAPLYQSLSASHSHSLSLPSFLFIYLLHTSLGQRSLLFFPSLLLEFTDRE